MRFRILLVAVLLFCSANLLAQTCTPMAGDACPGWARTTPSTGIVPLTVSFDTSPGSPGDVIPLFSLQFYHWDFGDGQTSTVYQPTHAYTAPGRYIATAVFKEVSNFQPGLMCGEDGGNCGNTFQTFTANITALDAITSLSLTPSVATMITGDSRTLSLQDNNGTPVAGAIWAVDQSSVISLSLDDPPILTANSPGTAIITASSRNISTHATIQVPDPGNTKSLPAGTGA